MEKIADLLKIFADKHLIPSTASLAVSILCVAFLPEALGISNSVGKFFYGVLIFCLFFLLLQFGKWIVKVFKGKITQKAKRRAEDQENKQNEQTKEKESLEKLWKYVDSLSPQDKNYLRVFLKNENQPIELIYEEQGWGLLSNKKIVVSTEKTTRAQFNNTMELDGRQIYIPNTMEYDEGYSNTTLYKLSDDFYDLLRYSYDKYKRISHFDTEEQDNGQTQDADSE